MFKDNDIIKINCPNCGMEYLPSEIYIPKHFFGSPKDIERTYDGKIIQFDGTSIDTKEEYKCDGCGKSFYINAQIKFQSYLDEKIDFDTDYSTPLKIKKFSLFEE